MEKLPYRVLQVVTIMNRGGIETMIMNHYRAVDRTKIQFDFLVHRQEKGDYDDGDDGDDGGCYDYYYDCDCDYGCDHDGLSSNNVSVS